MNNDLISREALIKDYFNAIEKSSIGEVSILDIIDNAPTVEIPVARWDCYCEGQKVGYEKALSERPQGEWIYKTKLDGIGWWYCSNCCELKEWIGKNSNFCPNCGADMRGKNNG